ncbi:pH-gated potassium channel KcsA [mine drainage metagenome]|uniref:pH-gated potassium channel KcsA n=1 Tax=mine drainage metagenome TaxID=410659 RepID=A0A1J5QYH9_9ZZZZ
MIGAMSTSDRFERYEARTSGPLTVLALAFLVVFGAPIVWPDLPTFLVRVCDGANVAIWALFAADLVARVALAERRWSYLARHPVDVLVVVVPMLRPLRVLRVFAAGQALLTRSRGLVQTGQAIVLAASVLIVIGALAILDAERSSPGANIASFPDALWWAITTVTTVGYGDRYPVTGLGRLVAAALMLVGISLLGLVTATVAAWFMRAEQQNMGTGLGVADRLRELRALHAGAIISDEEFADARTRLLADI